MQINHLRSKSDMPVPVPAAAHPPPQFLQPQQSQLHEPAREAYAPQPAAKERISHAVDEELTPGRMAAFDQEESESAKRRKLMGFFTTGTSAGVGCFEIADQSSSTYDVSGANCNSNNCPDCFITPATVSQDITLTIQACSSALWIRGQSRAGVWIYTFINTDATYTLSVTDSTGSGTTYKVPPQQFVTAYCAASLGTSNRLIFTSQDLPTLTVDSGLTLAAGNFDASGSTGTFTTSSGTNTLSGNTVISGSKTFTTGTGAVSLNGDTAVANSKTFTVGSAGNGGATTLYGATTVGASGNEVATNIYGNFAQAGATVTFSTGQGAVSLNGDVGVATGKNLHMADTGTGTFRTGTGNVRLNGNTEVTNANTFTTGTGAVSIQGDTTVSDSKTVTVGASAGAGGAITLNGATTVAVSSGTALTVAGDFSQTGATTFSTGTGQISLNGDVGIAAGKDLAMANGAGTVTTGTGTVTVNGNIDQLGATTFSTGTGAVVFNGATAVAEGKSFSVGTNSLTAADTPTQLFGTVTIGHTNVGRSLTVKGNVEFTQSSDNGAPTFSTGVGAITINGDVGMAADKNLIMATSGTGGLTTGTGNVNLNGYVAMGHGAAFSLNGVAVQCDQNSGTLSSQICSGTR